MLAALLLFVSAATDVVTSRTQSPALSSNSERSVPEGRRLLHPSAVTQLRDQLQRTLSGSYTIERELGGGGMSKVFVAEETRLKRKVVVKVLSPELAQGISVERFEREIQTVAALQHANIVPVCVTAVPRGASVPRRS